MDAEEPITFAVQAQPEDGPSWAGLARRAEEVGFEAIAVADHPGSTASPFVALAALAPVTSSIRLGTAVLNLGLWDPLALATEVATLQILSAGRTVLGVGAGHTPAEWTAVGRDRPSPQVRAARMAEVADAAQALLRGETVTVRTTHVHLDEAELRWPRRPVDPVPLLVGGNGRDVLRYGARAAAVVELTGAGRTLPDGHLHAPRWAPEDLDRRVALVRAERRRRPVRLGVLVQRVAVTADRADVLAAFRQDLVDLMGDDVAPSRADLAATPHVLVGTEDEIVAQLRAHRARWGLTRVTVRADAVEPLAPVIARLRADP